MQALEQEQANLHGAMLHLLSRPGTTVLALRLGIALRWFWYLTERLGLGSELLGAAVDGPTDDQPEALRARALGALAHMLGAWGASAQPRVEEGLALARELGDNDLMSDLLTSLSLTYFQSGDYERSVRAGAEAIDCGRHGGDPDTLAHALRTSFHRAVVDHGPDSAPRGPERHGRSRPSLPIGRGHRRHRRCPL